MSTPLGEFGEEEGGWRHDRRVAIVAVAVALISLIVGFSCLGSCRGKSKPPPGASTDSRSIVLICSNCQSEYTVTHRDVRGISGRDFAIKAAKVPCPKCKRTTGIVALRCQKCGKYFCPIADSKGTPTTACPHCKQDPWKP
jgi:hypothetical protein